ncbi:hypothetical protein [Candidatus Liberibacter sp.]|uniref:hypothetical protein n=1 Tax=Candidatus Liberibacter sp. TaxID=34022 RepID=UPI0015F50852|nr:hypothetical protein [Candidatus Liberibacter sp.]MBA5724365.1 hypothetical protein [Candidatus Liberibacter sp.]
MTLKKSALAFILLSSSVMLNGCDFFNPERHRTTKIDLISIVKQIQSSTAKNPLDKSTEQPLPMQEFNHENQNGHRIKRSIFHYTFYPQPPENDSPLSPSDFLELTDQQQKDVMANITPVQYADLYLPIFFEYCDLYTEYNREATAAIVQSANTGNEIIITDKYKNVAFKAIKAQIAHFNMVDAREHVLGQ